MRRTIRVYTTKHKKVPFIKWLNKIKDKTTKTRIKLQLDRISLGYFGNNKNIDKEIKELRLHFGPGYRIYYAEYNNNIVLLLLGGNKQSQQRDIALAKQYWKDFKERTL